MTLLVVDIGNTRIKWATVNADALHAAEPVVHRGHDIRRILTDAWFALETPVSIFVSCVASDAVRQDFAKWVTQSWDLQAEFLVSPVMANGITNAYTQYEQLGSDRWAAMVEAFNRFNSPVCVVNCGSAITLDLIDAQGLHMGGLILPGIASMRNALQESTDLELTQISQITEFGLGKTTQDGFMTGSIYSIAGLVGRAISFFEHEKGCVPRCVLSGGDADILSTALGVEHELDKDLVLKGLVRIAKRS